MTPQTIGNLADTPEVREFSQTWFGNRHRLKVLGVVIEVSPTPETEKFSMKEIADIAGVSTTVTFREFDRMSSYGMIERIGKRGGKRRGKNRTIDYVRLESGLWTMATSALAHCGIEVSLEQA